MQPPLKFHTNQHNSGFTLIELSIILVIIGLLVGGIVAAQVMIYNAQLRGIVSQAKELESAVGAFRIKFNCAPGDCASATTFFGSAGGTGFIADNTCRNNAVASKGVTGTCNGNGNGVVGSSGQTGSSGNYENYVLWQHLQLAGYIDGQYSPAGATISYGYQAGYNAPAGKFNPTSAWGVSWVGAAVPIGDTGYPYFSSLTGTMLIFGGTYNSGGFMQTINNGSILSPYDARSIDTKYDDGMPGSGYIQANKQERWMYNNGTACSTGNDPTTAAYRNSAAIECALFFRSNSF